MTLSRKQKYSIGGAFVVAVLLGLWASGNRYNPVIDPAKFSTAITNPYLTLPVGVVRTFEKKTAEGTERVEISIPGETRDIMGVKTLVYVDKVWLNGTLVEDTRDYLAQDAEGNVWYFGEDVDNYENGKLVDHEGSWIAGVDGAKPGIWFKARPMVQDSYRQEYYRGIAEDMVDVLSIDEAVEIPYGTFNNCVLTYDWTPLDPESRELKYYCEQAGGLVIEEDYDTGEQSVLTSVKK